MGLSRRDLIRYLRLEERGQDSKGKRRADGFIVSLAPQTLRPDRCPRAARMTVATGLDCPVRKEPLHQVQGRVETVGVRPGQFDTCASTFDRKGGGDDLV